MMNERDQQYESQRGGVPEIELPEIDPMDKRQVKKLKRALIELTKGLRQVAGGSDQNFKAVGVALDKLDARIIELEKKVK